MFCEKSRHLFTTLLAVRRVKSYAIFQSYISQESFLTLKNVSTRYFADKGHGQLGKSVTSGTTFLDGKVLLVERKLIVKPFSRFKVRTRGISRVHLKPTDLDAAQTFVAKLFGTEEQVQGHWPPTLFELIRTDDQLGSDKIIINACYEMRQLSHGADDSATLQLEIPHQSHVDIESDMTDANGQVTFDSIELRQVSCRLPNKGSLLASKLKCSTFEAEGAGGFANLEKTLMAERLDLKMRSGSIRGDQLRCSNVNLETLGDSIDVKTVYASKVTITTVSGDVRLGTISANCDINMQRGNLAIGCLDGTLIANLQNGNASVFLNDLNRDSHSSIVCERGHVELAISPELDASLHFEARELNLDPEFPINADAINKKIPENVNLFQGNTMKRDSMFSCNVSVMAQNGLVTLRLRNWLQAAVDWLPADWK